MIRSRWSNFEPPRPAYVSVQPSGWAAAPTIPGFAARLPTVVLSSVMSCASFFAARPRMPEAACTSSLASIAARSADRRRRCSPPPSKRRSRSGTRSNTRTARRSLRRAFVRDYPSPSPQLTPVFGSSEGLSAAQLSHRLLPITHRDDRARIAARRDLTRAHGGARRCRRARSARARRQLRRTQAESQAIATGAAAVFSPVDQLLQVDLRRRAPTSTPSSPSGSGVTLAQATATSYCLQVDLSGTVVHENGPGG